MEKNQLDLSDYPQRSYRSFNDFFTRRVLPEKRPIDQEPSHLIAPCDGKLAAYPIEPEASFRIKGVDYTLEELRDGRLAERYAGGMLRDCRGTGCWRYCSAWDSIAWCTGARST